MKKLLIVVILAVSSGLLMSCVDDSYSTEYSGPGAYSGDHRAYPDNGASTSNLFPAGQGDGLDGARR